MTSSRRPVVWPHVLRREVIPRLAERSGGRGSAGALRFAQILLELDDWLRVTAEAVGESRTALDVRVVLKEPVGVWYEIHADPPVVLVMDVWLQGRRR